MVSLTYFHRSNAHTLSTIFRTPIDRAGWQTKHRRLGADVLLRFLRAP
jgi:hypothetical protein